MGMVELLNASNKEEFGGWNKMSAPTPSVRLAVSLEIPAVSPTTTRINITSRATARMLTVVRTGRAARPATMIFLYMKKNIFLSAGTRAKARDYEVSKQRLGMARSRGLQPAFRRS